MNLILVRGKRIINGLGTPPVENGIIVIEGERIKAIGREDEIKIQGILKKIDCQDQTLLPGLIDCHNHLSLDANLNNYLHRMNDSIPELTLRAVKTMSVDLKSGVTTSRCLGDKGFLDVECKKAVNSDLISGPHLLVATRGIRAIHGHGFVGYPFGGIEQIRTAVRENIAAGADFIKIFITGTLRDPKGIPSYLSKDEIQSAVDEAHRLSIPVAAHCIGGVGLQWAVEAGVDTIEHGYFLTDREIELLVKFNRWVVMTPSVFLYDARIKNLPEGLIKGHLDQREEVIDRMQAIVKSGAKLAVGTDGMHGGLAQELQYLVDLGLSPRRAIMAATGQGAELCGIKADTGSLEPGKFADIIGVEGNPLEDIGSLKNVKTVIFHGKVICYEGQLKNSFNKGE